MKKIIKKLRSWRFWIAYILFVCCCALFNLFISPDKSIGYALAVLAGCIGVALIYKEIRDEQD